MAADTTAIRRWLLDEVHALRQQDEANHVRLAILRSLMRLIVAHDGTPSPTSEEASS